ncbi:MAG TPA: glycosyl hydrolase family 28-related protein [Pyrinomonadaceae bacterium]|jgi:hypothetical protein
MTRTIKNLFHALVIIACLFVAAGSARATAPTATTFTANVSTVGATLIQLQGNDPDGTALVFAFQSSPLHGTITAFNSATGYFVYTPNSGYTGTDGVFFAVTSGGQTSSSATCSIVVTNAKTRIIDTLVDASGNARQGSVTFILTMPVTSPAGVMPTGSTVSSALNSSGQFDVSVYPSRALSPQSFYQVWYADSASLKRELIGVYDIPASVTSITLAGRRVIDTNLAKQYVFVSVAELEAHTSAVATRTLSELLGPNLTIGGTMTAQKFEGNCGDCTGITGQVGGNSALNTLTQGGDTDADGTGKVAFQTRNIDRLVINNDGGIDLKGGFPTSTLAGLPAVGNVGRIYRLTDGNKGLVIDTGVTWKSLNGGDYNIDDWGAKPNDATFDSQPAIQAAVDAVEALATASGRTKSARVYVPIGTYYLSKPVRFKIDGTIFTGAGKSLSILKAKSGLGGGNLLVVGPGTNANPSLSYDDVPTTTALATGTGAAYSMPAGNSIYFNFRDSAAWDIDGRTAMSLEFIFKPTVLDGTYRTILVGGGNESPNQAGNNYTLVVAVTTNNALETSIRLGDTLYTLTSANNSLVAGSSYVVQFNFSPNADPTKADVRQFLNGTLTASTTTATGKYAVTQHEYEDVILGQYFQTWPEYNAVLNSISCVVDSIRLSSVARNTAGYSAPLTKLVSDGNTLWLTNWLIDGMQMVATSSYGTEYLPLRRPTFINLANYVEISNMRLEPDGGSGRVGGIYAYLSPRANFHDLYIDFSRVGIRFFDNSFLSSVRDVEIYGDTNSRGNIFNLSSSGVNYFDNLQLFGPNYNIVGINGGGQINHSFLHGGVRYNLVLGNADSTSTGTWTLNDVSVSDEDASFSPEAHYQGPAMLFNMRGFQMLGGTLESVYYTSKYPRISGGDKYTFVGTVFNTNSANDRQIDFPEAGNLPLSPVMLVNAKNCGATYPPTSCTEIPWTTSARAANVVVVGASIAINPTNGIVPYRSTALAFLDSPIAVSVPGSMVNKLTVTGGATGTNPEIAATGSDSTLDAVIKGTGDSTGIIVKSGSGINPSIHFGSTSGGIVLGSTDGQSVYIGGANGPIMGVGTATVGIKASSVFGFTQGQFYEAIDTGLARNAAGRWEANNGTPGVFRDFKLRQLYLDPTMTTAGTTGAQTINKAAGSVNFAAAATSLVVTDSLVTAASIVVCTVQTNDSTLKSVQCVPTSGSFTIYANAAATAETKIAFVVINQ